MMAGFEALWRLGKETHEPPPQVVSPAEFDRYIGTHDQDMQIINEMVAAVRNEHTDEVTYEDEDDRVRNHDAPRAT